MSEQIIKTVRACSQYYDIRLPDGSHSGVRVDPLRSVLEIQRRGIKYYFDLTQIVALPIAENKVQCYDG